jgi:nitroreductase
LQGIATDASPKAMNSPVLDAIYQRRSIRTFTNEPVERDQLREIVKAGIWAPSGLNNQPWRFAIVTDPALRAEIAKETRYSHIVLAAPAIIAVYLDEASMYDAVKDHQAAGACIENMLLAAEALGLGAVWLGQILQNKENVRQLLGLREGLDLMAVIAIGHPDRHDQQSSRKPIEHFIIKEV